MPDITEPTAAGLQMTACIGLSRLVLIQSKSGAVALP